MAESSRRFRKSTSRSIAASSAIALALGGISIVGPGPLAPHAAADTLRGGIREKSGAVEQDVQQESDLPAGSCVVDSGKPSGSQAGFSWNTLEPNAESPDKKAWGLSVSFDNSKDRTFTDWYFSNTGDLKDVLNTGQVPSMEADQTFLGKSVTHKADESIDITASGRRLRSLNVYADLTGEKVKQFASASAGNPVRYAWQSNYKQDNPYGSNATQGGSATFGATVNPWPSENIECNPISVSWESAEVAEKHVIVPGEETKVGHINVPELSNGETDDSLSRMVVEAYDGNGEFIGTTDPEASGGEQLLRVDEKTGDIFFTWPEYRGTDQATDKNVNFSVLAKPRSVNQLQAATEHNNDGNGEAFDSSNSLDRYSKANVIDSKAFSLDDTEYHDPKYDKTDASIISGVDSATGPLATEPQKVTFTQVSDLIKDLEKKKGDGGFEAKVSLDEKYVYDGWTVEMDEDYNVTVTAPEEPKPGTFARPVVTVEYSNGSTDELELLVVVDPNNTQVTDLVRPSLTKGTIGDDLTAQVGTKSIMKGHKPVHPAKFEVDPSTVPDGWTVTVDDTGKVTAKADDTVAPGTIITPKVKATYPDQTTDEIETQFQAVVDIKVPDYDTVTNKPGTNVSLPPTVPDVGLSGNKDDEAPTRYTFEGEKTELTIEDEAGTWTVKIDEETGEITTTIPRTAPEGHVLDVPVLAYYSEEKPQQVKGTVVVLKGDIAPVYSVESTGPSKPVDHQIQDAPKGSTYSFGKDENDEPITEMETVDGWKYTIDPDTGVVSSTPPADSKPGDKKTISVTVDTPDGSSPKVPVTTVVNLANNWEADPTYPEETVYPGGTATLPVTLEKPDNVNVAEENPYKLGDLPEGWTVSIDDNGVITATSPADAEPGSQVEIPVTVTYEDGSTDTAKAVVNVVDVPTRELPFDVEYKFDDTIPAGEYKVETEGAPGEEKQNKDGTWEQTTAPTNEVVVIGTKPAESAKDVTWTFPIPFPTEVRENSELAPGETKVVQEGEKGEKTYTAKFTAKGDKADVVEDENTKEPVKRIIEYGPRLGADELVTKTDKPIPFTTKVVFDDTLAEGEQVVDQQGELGNEVSTSTQKLVDGKPSGDPTVTTERTKEPTEQIIRVGTKTAGQTVNSVEAEIPFPTRIVYDPTLAPGEQKVTQEGKPGTKKVTVTQPVENSQPNSEATSTEEILEEPTEQIIAVGTKPDEATEQVEWTAPVPFNTEVKPNPELKPGEVKVVTEGVLGEKKFTADFSSKGSDATVTPKEEQTKDPVDALIEYGPTIADQTLISTKTREVAFETEIVFDETLPAGEQVVDQQGEKGEELITSTQEIKDGKPSGEPTISTEETKAPKKAIIRVGTKQVDPDEPAPAPSPSVEPLTIPVAYPVKYEFDPNLPAGEEVVDQEGTPGSKTLRPKLEMVDGKPVWTIEEVETQKPVQRVVRVGTKQAETNPFTWTSEVPFNTTVKPNPELAPGESRVVQVGENGSTKYSADPATGEVTKLEEKKPVERIVEYGPKDDVAVTKVTRPVPFETEVIYDPDLPEGAQRIEQGEVGEEVVTTTQNFKDGQLVGEPTTNTERTREPKNAVVRIGTKKTPKNASVTELEVPPTTQLIFDPSLEPGEQVVVREGTPGTVRVTTVDDETTVENTLDAIPRLVRVGAKQPDQLNWLEPLPFKVIATENPDLPAGEHKVIQEGKPGLVQHVGDTATTVTEPQDYILEIGTAKDVQEKREVITEPIPFETIVEEDDTLAAGVVKVVTQGENGAKRTTKVWEMKEGKELGDPTVTDETLREPTNLVIRVGTGKPVEEKPEDPKPEQPKPDTPVEDEKGSSAERCVANAFAANSPLLWLLPVGLLGAIGYGVNEMYGPQINQASGALNARWEAFVRENTPDFGHGHRGIEKPEWVRQAEAQANALNQQFNQRFAGYGEQLRPVGIALGALAAVALTGTLIAQACSEEGFDNGMTVLGSTERKLDFGASSEKADGAKAGSSSREAGSSKKNALTTAAKPTGEK
ncbi:Putative surface protein precursor [Corynebacterium afermentans subsp. afermentans]|uniref:G5 domain-containing protein n=1 Tax=Corynebacterium afermentans TaxID=38286 RepID=A0A9X8R7C2_9CORY|nr:G5 domain-containing protein [Corynebacterium afermentans]OAA16912.1 cell surface protein [Corynebacterium afermentans subsp. afermentans]WJY55795.1 Putative surface protein precursor [Corynebacterium afermentans subsp. afermentans]SIQ81011.1 G5 domain-containing protein [Corynebacterium afermentans]